jgi:hypothetical protein
VPPGIACASDARPSSVVPWFDGESPTSVATFAAPPRASRYWRGIIPPCEWPTTSTFAAPVALRTRSTKADSSTAESAIEPVALSGRLAGPP